MSGTTYFMDQNSIINADGMSAGKNANSDSLFSFLFEAEASPNPAPVRIHRGPVRIEAEFRKAAEALGLSLPSTIADFERDSVDDLAERDLDAGLQLLLQRVREVTTADAACVALRDRESLVNRAASGTLPISFADAVELISPLIAESVPQRQLILFNNIANETSIDLLQSQDARIASVAVMPLVSEGEAEGVLVLFSARPHAFAEKDLPLIERSGENIQTAIEEAGAAIRLRTTRAAYPDYLPVEVIRRTESDNILENDEILDA
ncbi:MAG TPA: GAF domain-containing protein [Terriglobales bacterium]|nr:GAF domain-containing protein [Terriglobales bacterium]